jgi:AraC family transcriptional regulator
MGRDGAAEPSCLRGGLARWQAKRIASYIEDKLDSSIRVTALAGVVQLSTSHFFRAFRKTFGETPVAYVRKRRIRRAQELMLTSRLPLSQVAVECGMCDQPHLCRVFRRIVGVNPNAWRRQLPVGPAPRQFHRPANPDSDGAMSPDRGFAQIAKRVETHR